MKKSTISFLVVAILAGALSGLLSNWVLDSVVPITDEDRIAEFYQTETAVMVSPHHIRKGMDKGDDSFIIVDVRSQEEYEREHVIGAINIPAYKDPYTSAYGDVERIVGGFAELDQEKDIIVYCYSIPCMTGRKVGAMLAEHDIYVQELGVGWNEWRYYWDLWNHEHELETTLVEDYVYSGAEPGVPTLKEAKTDACSASEAFGC